MGKIINIDGRMFQIDSDTLSLEQENEIINITQARISKLASGCGITIPKGTTKNIRCTASSGTGRYKYELFMNGTRVDQSPAGTGGSYIFTYPFLTAGTFAVSIKVTDDCSTPSTCTDQNCTITVTEGASNLSSIELTGCAAQPKQLGDSCTLTVVCKDSIGAIITCPTLTYTSSNTSVVTVNSTTRICTAVANGTANVTASASGVTSNSIPFTVGTMGSKPILTSMIPTNQTVGLYTTTLTGQNFDSGANGESYDMNNNFIGSSANRPGMVRTETSITWSGNLGIENVGTYKMKVKNGNGQYSDNVITYNVIEASGSKPILTSMSPLNTVVGDQVHRVVIGTNFNDTSDVIFHNIDDLYADGHSSNHNPIITSTTITLDSLQGNYPGTYEVYVKNGDGQVSNTITSIVTEETKEPSQMNTGLIVAAGLAIGYILTRKKDKKPTS